MQIPWRFFYASSLTMKRQMSKNCHAVSQLPSSSREICENWFGLDNLPETRAASSFSQFFSCSSNEKHSSVSFLVFSMFLRSWTCLKPWCIQDGIVSTFVSFATLSLTISEPVCKWQVQLPKPMQTSAPCDLATSRQFVEISKSRVWIALPNCQVRLVDWSIHPWVHSPTWYWSETACSPAGLGQEVTSNFKQCFDAKPFTCFSSDLLGFPNTGIVSAQSSTSWQWAVQVLGVQLPLVEVKLCWRSGSFLPLKSYKWL